MTNSVVLDTTVLSNFAKVGRSDLIARLWGHEARVTEAAMAEYQGNSILAKMIALGFHSPASSLDSLLE